MYSQAELSYLTQITEWGLATPTISIVNAGITRPITVRHQQIVRAINRGTALMHTGEIKAPEASWERFPIWIDDYRVEL